MSSRAKRPATKGDGNLAPTPKLRFPEFVGQSWRDVRLQDVTVECTIRNGESLSSESVMGVMKSEGIIPMKERLIGADISRYKLVRRNWFAYNPMRLNIGSIARWTGDRDILVSPDYVVFRCLEAPASAIDPDYLDHFRRSDQWEDFVTESGIGSVRVRIYYSDIARLQLKLPPPAEQRSIAACLSSVDALIAAQVRKLDALNTHNRGLLQQLFPCEGETQPRLRFPEFRDAPEWRESTLGMMCESISSGRDKADSGGSFDLYGSTGIIGKTSSGTFAGKFILVARVGANAGLLTKTSGTFGVTDNTIVIILKDAARADFIFYYLNNLGLNKLAYGSGQPLLTGGQLKGMAIHSPDELERQRIAECLCSLDDQIASESKKLDALRTHKKGLMQQLFPSAEQAP